MCIFSRRLSVWKKIDVVILSVPLGRIAGEMALVVCVETPGCDGREEELQMVNRSHSTGCQTGCQHRCFPSCLSCRPSGIKENNKIIL